MIIPPCHRDCPNRSSSCHGECEDYILYAKKKEEERQNRKKYKDTRYFDASMARRRRFV